MFRIAWRDRSYLYGFVRPVIRGVSRYTSPAAAQSQIDKWAYYFPQNTYYIEPA